MIYKYNSYEEIDRDLLALDLQRRIAMEELKFTKYEFQESVAPNKWADTLLSALKKYGIFYIIKKILK